MPTQTREILAAVYKPLLVAGILLLTVACGQRPGSVTQPAAARDTAAASTPTTADTDVPLVFDTNGAARLAYVDGLGQLFSMRQDVQGGAVLIHWAGVYNGRVMVYISEIADPGYVVVPTLGIFPRLTTADGTNLQLLDATGLSARTTAESDSIQEYDAGSAAISTRELHLILALPKVPIVSESESSAFDLRAPGTPSASLSGILPGPVSFNFIVNIPTAAATPQAVRVPPSAALPTSDAAIKWAIKDASPADGPPARVVQAQLMTLADAMRQDVDHSWVNAVPPSQDFSTPVWVIEVDGAANPASCPPVARQACARPVRLILIVNALTAQPISWNFPHSDPATPTP